MNEPLASDSSLQDATCAQAGVTTFAHRKSALGKRKRHFAGFFIIIASLLWCVSGEAPVDARVNAHWIRIRGSSSMLVGKPMTDVHGVKYFPVRSIYQGSENQIVRVLEPTQAAPGKPRRILYVLPVDTGVENLKSSWSDGLEELRLLDVPNRFNMVLIAPSFTYEPWYGDNTLNGTQRIESFIIHDLVPFADTFADGQPPERLLIGFSKSGNGALELILRHPTVFSKAAAWDCPAQIDSVSAFKALQMNFGTQANFDRYNIPSLISAHSEAFRHQNRLWISGDQSIFTSDMIQLHKELSAASIPHIWSQGNVRVHSWHSGWLNGAVASLDAMDSTAPVSGD